MRVGTCCARLIVMMLATMACSVFGFAHIAAAAGGVITTVAGGGNGDGGPAVSAMLRTPFGITVAPVGNVYIADTGSCRVREVSGGTIDTVAGTDPCGYSGDGGPSTAAQLGGPYGVALDAVGNLYVADPSNCRVRLVSGGTITTIAGNGSCAYSGDGGPATSAALNYPLSVAVDGAGDIYVADSFNCRVRKVSGGIITTVAGTGACASTGDGGPAVSAALLRPYGLAFGAAGDLYISETDGCRVRKISGGIITTVAGDGACGYSGDGGPAPSAQLYKPYGIALDASDNLYIADSVNCRVREVSTGIITTIAGTGTCGDSGDGGVATSAALRAPSGVAADATGAVYIADTSNCRVRKVNSGIITTLAGNGGCGYAPDGVSATSVLIGGPAGAVLSATGDLYFTDNGCRVRKVSGGIITTVAGAAPTVACGFSGDGLSPTSAQLDGPWGLALAAGDLYIADTNNCRVRKVSGGTITTVAGDGTCGFAGDGGPALAAELNFPDGVALDAGGDLYIADTTNCRIRKVSGGTITTVAGTGACGYSGDGGPAAVAELYYPTDLALDVAGSLYIADHQNCRVRKVSGGTITTVAGGSTCGFAGDGGLATSALLNGPTSVAFDATGDLYIADFCHVRKVSGGTISTIVGTGTCMYSGDGGPATDASLDRPLGIALDSAGNLYVADTGNDRVRRMSPVAAAGVGGIAAAPDLAALRTPAERAERLPGVGWSFLALIVGVSPVGSAVWLLRCHRSSAR